MGTKTPSAASRGGGSNHAAWQGHLAKEEKALAPRQVRSASTPALRPLGPYGLVPEKTGSSSSSSGRRAIGSSKGFMERLPAIDEACGSNGVNPLLGEGENSWKFGTKQRERIPTGMSRVSTSASSNGGRSQGGRSRLSATSIAMFNDGERREAPRLRTGSQASSLGSSASAMAVRKEIGDAVQEQIAKALGPLAERLEKEKSARKEVEALLEKASQGTGVG